MVPACLVSMAAAKRPKVAAGGRPVGLFSHFTRLGDDQMRCEVCYKKWMTREVGQVRA